MDLEFMLKHMPVFQTDGFDGDSAIREICLEVGGDQRGFHTREICFIQILMLLKEMWIERGIDDFVEKVRELGQRHDRAILRDPQLFLTGEFNANVRKMESVLRRVVRFPVEPGHWGRSN
jgi:hypothetical protein